MASGLEFNITIGAAVGGALAGLTSVNRSVAQLGKTSSRLMSRQQMLGDLMENPLRMSKQRVGELRREYVRLGTDIERIGRAQAHIGKLQGIRTSIGNTRAQLKSEIMGNIAAIGTIALPVKLAIDFESSMADVRKVVDFDTPEQFKAFNDEILQMTRILPKSGAELAQIAASGGQLGVARDDLPDFITTVAKMSVAFDMSADQAGDSMAKLANVYKIPIGRIGELGDAINELSNTSPAKASDIVNALSRVGGVAKQFGLTEFQAASLTNTMIALGKSPEVASTSINALMTKMMTAEKGGKAFQGALRLMGVDAKQLAKNIKQNPEQALINFMKRIKSLPQEKQMGVLVDLFGREYADDIAVLAGNLDQYEQSIRTLTDTTEDGKLNFLGSMDKEFSARAATTENNLHLLKNGVFELGITVGSVLLPSLNDTLNTMRPMIGSFVDWAQANPEVITSIVKMVGALVAFKAGSFAVRAVFNEIHGLWTLIRMAKSMVGVQWLRATMAFRYGNGILRGSLLKVGAGLKWLKGLFPMLTRAAMIAGRAMMTTPIGLAIGAAVLAGWWLYENWDNVCGFVVDRWSALTDWWTNSTLVQGIQSYLTDCFEWWSGFWSNVYGFAVDRWDALTDWWTTSTLVQSIQGYLTDFFEWWGGFWDQLTDDPIGTLTDIGAAIINWSPLGLFYQAFAPALNWFGFKLPADFSSFIGNIWRSITDGISSWQPLEWIEKAFSGVAKWFSDLGASIKTEISSWFSTSQSVMQNIELQRNSRPSLNAAQEHRKKKQAVLQKNGVNPADYDSGKLSTEQYRDLDRQIRNEGSIVNDIIQSGSNLNLSAVIQESNQQQATAKQSPSSVNITYAPVINAGHATSNDALAAILNDDKRQLERTWNELQRDMDRVNYA